MVGVVIVSAFPYFLFRNPIGGRKAVGLNKNSKGSYSAIFWGRSLCENYFENEIGW